MKKFFGVIGNPPYQEEQKGKNKNYAPPIYHHFMDEAFKLGKSVELITPARFLFDAGSTPKAWNEKMLHDPHLKVIYYEADSSNVFPTTDIKGGIAVTYRDDKKDYGAIKEFFAFDELESIARKVEAANEGSITEIMYAAESYRFTDKLHADCPHAESKLSSGHKYDLKTSVLESLADEVFFTEKPGEDFVEVLGLVKGQRCFRWVRSEYIQGPDNFKRYKVILPKSNGSGALGEVLSTPLVGQPLVGQPLVGHTQSFLSIGSFDSVGEAEACLKYVKCKFARTLLGVLKVTQDNPAPRWRYVPLQDFTSMSDIDWLQSVSDIDRQLYVKYGLSDDEIDFIETHVKEME